MMLMFSGDGVCLTGEEDKNGGLIVAMVVSIHVP